MGVHLRHALVGIEQKNRLPARDFDQMDATGVDYIEGIHHPEPRGFDGRTLLTGDAHLQKNIKMNKREYRGFSGFRN